MKRCAAYVDMLSAGIDNEVSPEELRQLLDHLMACARCARLGREMLQATQRLHDLVDHVCDAPAFCAPVKPASPVGGCA